MTAQHTKEAQTRGGELGIKVPQLRDPACAGESGKRKVKKGGS